MTVNWIDFPEFDKADQVRWPWTMAHDVFENVNHVRLAATGTWKILPGLDIPSDPDGIAGLPLADSALILPGAPAGCLLGRFGGSSAGTVTVPPVEGQTAAANPVFMIGSNCLIKLPEGVRGPLYFAFNVAAGPVKVEKFTLKVTGTTL